MDVVINRTKEVYARREVILSAGAYDSPRLLLLSGVGPKDDLDALGIPVVVPLPGVGQNLRDHNMLTLAGPLLKNQSTPIASRIVPADGYRLFGPDDDHTKNTPLKWMLGIDISGEAPNKRIICNLFPFQPHSVGNLKLKSSDPFVDPLIDPAYLTDAAGYDYTTFIAGIREFRRIYSTSPLSDILQGPETEATPGWNIQTEDEIGAFIKATATDSFHPVGTCKMGPESDPMAVVDSQLRVRGVEGLRVVDASIMPSITSGHINTPIAMIATKAAQLILQGK